ncbi:sigma factor-like helix-turn-helix DNA-binding protein [Lichenifustis flavocetrariae]|uniref:sigma factor-like helix-turn-helix DNA-binding protein n=1 Tax=Lichenifustis flavocetrariae TaxID=2949735 RepID=UPI003D115B0A
MRDLLRLKHENGLSSRVIATSLGLSKGAVGEYLRRARSAGVSFPLDESITDTGLKRLLFPMACDVMAVVVVAPSRMTTFKSKLGINPT